MEEQAPDIKEDETASDYFRLVQEEGRIYAYFGGKYEIIEPGQDVAIPEGYKAGSLTISGITIKAYIPENNEQSEFVLIYAQNEFGNKGFYKYDRIEKTLQRYSDSGWVIENEKTTEAEKSNENSSLTKAVFVIVLLCALCILMTFIAVRMYIKLKGYKDDELE